MKTDEAFKQKVKADIALVEAELGRFKVRGMGFTAEAKGRHDEHVERLEQKIDEINNKLSDLDKADKDRRGELKERIEESWHALQAELKNAIETFATEEGVAEAHGGDDGPFPYGEGLSRLSNWKTKAGA